MSKCGPQAVKEFSNSAYNHFGMRVVVLAAYVDVKGESSMSL
jgi:hypothetical protein